MADGMKAKTLMDLGCACDTCRQNGGEGCETYPDGIIPSGTAVEHPDAFRLVYAGVAVAADDECEEAVTLTPLQMARAQLGARRAAAGIHPEDFEAFDAGEMMGYYPDGSPVPGPNAKHSEGGLLLYDYDD